MGSTIINPSDNGLEVAKGNVDGTTGFYSLGERSSVGTTATGEDVWEGTATTIPEPPDVGEQMTLVSTMAADDIDSGTGIQTVRIEYLDATGAEQTEDVDLEGVTTVNTMATDIRFVNAIYAVAVGSGGVAAGIITIYKLATPATVYNMIAVGGNMSMVTNRMIPLAKSFYLTGWNATANVAAKPVTVRIRSTQRNGALLDGVFLFIDSAALELASYTYKWAVPVCIPALAIVKVSAWTGGAGASVSAGFDGYLVDD